MVKIDLASEESWDLAYETMLFEDDGANLQPRNPNDDGLEYLGSKFSLSLGNTFYISTSVRPSVTAGLGGTSRPVFVCPWCRITLTTQIQVHRHP